MSRKFKIMSAALAAAFIAGAGPAISQTSGEIIVRGRPLPQGTEQRIVRIGDLNLRTELGKSEMERRVNAAVESICNTSNGNQPLEQKRLDDECRKGAWASARLQMNAALERARSTAY